MKQKVEVIYDPLKGYRGEVVQSKGKSRLRILIEHLNCSMLVDIDCEYLISL